MGGSTETREQGESQTAPARNTSDPSPSAERPSTAPSAPKEPAVPTFTFTPAGKTPSAAARVEPASLLASGATPGETAPASQDDRPIAAAAAAAEEDHHHTASNWHEAADILGEEDASTADWKPVVELDLVETKSGEEDEEAVDKFRAKLYRFDKEMKEWKERGTGEVKFLRHRETRKVRLLMRRQQTLKICANHFIHPAMELEENVGSDRSWVWTAVDYADEERDEAVLAIRFKDSETAARFREVFNAQREHMRQQLERPREAEGEEEKRE
eukprot:ctg_289.g176